MKERIAWIDVTKGMAILLVIAGHCFIGYKINDLIFAFHMPLFFVLSGYLWREKGLKDTLVGNARKLLVPYAITGVLYTIGRGVSGYIQGWSAADIIYLIKHLLFSLPFGFGVDESRWLFQVWSVGAIWFLMAFFWNAFFMQILFALLRGKCEIYRAACVAGVSALCYIVANYIWIPTNVDIGGFALIYSYGGYLLARGDVLAQAKKIWFWISCGVLLWYCYLTGGVNMVIRLYPNAVSVVGSFAGCLLAMKLGQILSKRRIVTFVLSWYGKNSLRILCVHLFEMMVIPWDFATTWIENDLGKRLFLLGIKILFATAVVAAINGCKKIGRLLHQRSGASHLMPKE